MGDPRPSERGDRMNCAICTELNSVDVVDPMIGFNRIVWEDDDFVVVPTVGCFAEGYVMLMPKDHTFSMAQLEPAQLLRADEVTKKLHAFLAEEYGLPVTIAEHGAVDCQVKGAQCCDHAHLHFIPVPCTPMSEYLKIRLPDHRTPSLSSLRSIGAEGVAYILASGDTDGYSIWMESTGFKSQFCRMVGARAYGIEEKYNWKTHPFFDKMALTVARMRGKFTV